MVLSYMTDRTSASRGIRNGFVFEKSVNREERKVKTERKEEKKKKKGPKTFAARCLGIRIRKRERKNRSALDRHGTHARLVVPTLPIDAA
jgi:hypothetical protein